LGTPTRPDTLRLAPGLLDFSGWVFDPDSAAVVRVSHTVDGGAVSTVPASDSRPDVGAHYPMYGTDRGYSDTADLAAVPAGSHVFCAVAINLDAGSNTSLACTTGVVRHSPFGGFDSLTQTPDGLAVVGWAIEPDLAGPATVTGTLDGAALADLQAGLERSDVGRIYPIDGAQHGFSTVLPVPAKEGSHAICLTVANVGTGPVATAKCRTIVVAHKPFGRFDVVSVGNGQVTVGGWSIDRHGLARTGARADRRDAGRPECGECAACRRHPGLPPVRRQARLPVHTVRHFGQGHPLRLRLRDQHRSRYRQPVARLPPSDRRLSHAR